MGPVAATSPARILQRYAMYDRFAQGGMATVHYGRLLGPVGFSRTVAVKRLHGHLLEDPELVSMLADEARLASRIRHPNVVQTLDVVAMQGEVFVVLDYVHGEALSRLARVARDAGETIPTGIAAAILFDVLQGLHAAHQARDPAGQPLEIVHRDVSPQNILVGADGAARVIDFGVAKARGRAQTTREGQLKGKLAYMAPEQIRGQVSPRSDVFSASVVLWEGLTGRRLFDGDDEGTILGKLVAGEVESPTRYAPGLPPALVDVVMRGLARDPAQRFASAREMAVALEGSIALSTPIDVGSWVERLARDALAKRAARIAAIESESASSDGSAAAASPTGSTTSTGVAPPASTELATGTAVTAPVLGLAQPPERDVVRGKRASRKALLPRRRGALGAAIAMVVVVGAGLSTRAALRGSDPPAPEPLANPASLAAASALPASPSEDPPAESPAAAAPAALGAAALVASNPSSTAPITSTDAHPRSTTSGPSPARSAPRQRPRPGARCSPPYVTDSMGLRHYKPECL